MSESNLDKKNIECRRCGKIQSSTQLVSVQVGFWRLESSDGDFSVCPKCFGDIIKK